MSVLIVSSIWTGGIAAKDPTPDDKLEFPAEMKLKVDFWKAIYTKYTVREGLLHDAEDLSVIYDAIELPKNGSTFAADELRYIIRERLFNIVRRRGENLTPEERKLLSRFPPGTTRARLIQATENIRFQLGQQDRFKQGIIRSGYYMKHIEKILADQGLPDFIKYLPHVESSFQEYAISKFGAAGLWQLMETTGKMFNLRINYAVDERLDPWLATVAAAKHLKRDYIYLGRWPLAFTAYNHGPGGVQKAMRTVGSSDIEEIVFRYTSPSFGFASRNFYAQYLAAVEVASHHQKYFGDLPIKPTLTFDGIPIKKATYLKDLSKNYQFSMEEFKALNPALRKPVLENSRPIPEGTLVRVPINSKKADKNLVASIEKRPKIIAANPDKELLRADKELRASALSKVEKAKVPEIRPVAVQEPEKAPAPMIKEKLSKVSSPFRVIDLKDKQGWARMEINETLSQVADWMQASPEELRSWNGLETDEQAQLGQKLLLKFDRISPDQFEQAREDYHQKIKEDFFIRFEVAKLTDYEVKRGENLWSLCYQKFDVPAWLLQEYNPKVSVSNLPPGTKIKVPVLREKDLEVASTQN